MPPQVCCPRTAPSLSLCSHFPPTSHGPGSCGLCQAGISPGRRLGTGEVRLLAEGGSLSSAVWLPALVAGATTRPNTVAPQGSKQLPRATW